MSFFLFVCVGGELLLLFFLLEGMVLILLLLLVGDGGGILRLLGSDGWCAFLLVISGVGCSSSSWR